MPLTRSNKKSKTTLGTEKPKTLQRKSSTSTICEVSDSEENHSNSSSKNSKPSNVRVRNVKDPKVPRSKSKSQSRVKKRPALLLHSNVPNAISWGNEAYSTVGWDTLVARRKRRRTATPELTLGSEQSSEDSEGTPAPPAAKKAKNDENAQGS